MIPALCVIIDCEGTQCHRVDCCVDCRADCRRLEGIEQSKAVRVRVGTLYVIDPFCTAVYPPILVGIDGCTCCNDLSLF